jgi:hypothetical protein
MPPKCKPEGKVDCRPIMRWREALEINGCAPPKKGTVKYDKVKKTYEDLKQRSGKVRQFYQDLANDKPIEKKKRKKRGQLSDPWFVGSKKK